MVSNGPFKLKEWKSNEVVVVEKSPEYWDAAHVVLKEAHFHPIVDLRRRGKCFSRRPAARHTSTCPWPS